MSWADLAAGAPDLAEAGLRLINREEIGQGLLVTIRGSAAPRIHPVYVAVREGRLLTFADGAKRTDLEQDGRFALHTHLDPSALSEFSVRGRARPIDGDLRDQIAAGWYFDPGTTYRLFELEVESALHGDRPDANAWPPVYSSWKAGTEEAP